MRVIHLLTGCVLGLCLAATAQASVNAGTVTGGGSDRGRTSASSGASRDNGPAGGELMGLPGSSSSNGHAGASSSGKSDDNAIHDSSGGGDAPPSPSHRVSLGWQSLLPGSIQ